MFPFQEYFLSKIKVLVFECLQKLIIVCSKQLRRLKFLLVDFDEEDMFSLLTADNNVA